MDNIKYCDNCLIDTNIKHLCALPNCNYNVCNTCYNTSYNTSHSVCLLTGNWYCNNHVQYHDAIKYFNYNVYSYWS